MHLNAVTINKIKKIFFFPYIFVEISERVQLLFVLKTKNKTLNRICNFLEREKKQKIEIYSKV